MSDLLAIGPELGQLILLAALVITGLQAVLPLWGAQRNDGALMALGSRMAVMQLVTIALAFALLTKAFVTSDFSVLTVANNSHSLKPMLYKISGVWGNHEGSLLLWVLILALFGAAVAVFGGNLPTGLKARVLAVQAMIALGFLSFMVFTSNPFERVVPPPPDGNGLNPLLQDPGLAFHPPFLYLGYVGFSIAFSFAIAALIEGRVDGAWARWVRPWTLAAWMFLTIGIALGSWWAYYELGWGGFWFWDPVENASFMPWLLGTALLHSAIVVEKRDSLKSWTILLAILTFSLSLLGTFLVRSGVLTSVHAFATDPERGVFILAFLVFAIGGSLALYAWRAPQMKGGGLFEPISRETGLIVNNWLLASACATVLVGTLYPLFLDALTGDKVSVGPPYFNLTFGPIMVPLILVMALGPFLPWKRGEAKAVLQRVRFALIAGVLAGALVVVFAFDGPLYAALGFALGIWLLSATLLELGGRLGIGRLPIGTALARLTGLPRSSLGMSLAHFGFGIVVLGVTANTAWTNETHAILKPGESAQVGDLTFTLDDVEEVQGPNYIALRGTVSVSEGAGETPFITFQPETRAYQNPPQATTEAAIRPTVPGDIFAVVGEPDGRGGFAARFYFKPLVSWIWLGSILMALGALLSLTDRRHRVGVKRSARLVAEPAE